MIRSRYFAVILMTALFGRLLGQEVIDYIQSDPADTIYIPHYGNNQILDEVLAYTMKASPLSKGSIYDTYYDEITFHIPLKVWILENTNHTSRAFSPSDVPLWLDDVNQKFSDNNTGIQFYLKCDPEIVASTEYNTINDDSEFIEMGDTYNESHALDVYLVTSYYPGLGVSVIPWRNEDKRFRTALDCPYGSYSSYSYLLPITVHEFGHSLGLLHTHENFRGAADFNADADNCFQESVSRNRTNKIGCLATYGDLKCEINGDLLCDTDAAPNTEDDEWIDVDNSCNWSGSGTDNWGDTWIPPTTNYMSYLTDEGCHTEFTQGQVATMHENILLYMETGGGVNWYNQNGVFLSSTVYGIDNEVIYSPEYIEAPPSPIYYHLMDNSTVSLIAGKSITLEKGFLADNGAAFTMSIGTAPSCSDISWMTSPAKGTGSSHSYTQLLPDDRFDDCKRMLRDALVEKNGNIYNFSSNEITTILQNESQNQYTDSPISVYPNPSKGVFKISLSNNQYCDISVYDSSGKLIDCFSPNSKPFIIDLSSSPSGVYFIVAILEDGSQYHITLIKE